MIETQSEDPYALSMPEFVTMMAFLMALTALSVDIMLPVLPDIVDAYALEDVNDQQFMVTVYLAAFAFGHIFVGPLSDRLGRRPGLLAGLVIYLAGTLLSVFAQSYTVLLLARAIQGFGAAGPRVIAVAVVRDRFVGRAMSQVLSFVMLVFIILPIIAPALGSLIGNLGTWRTVFSTLFVFAALTLIWVAWRLPESNPRSGPNAKPSVPLLPAMKTMLGSTQTLGYTIALGFAFGCLFTYISTTQQMFADIYGIVDWFPLVFASVAGAMVVSALTNSALVRRLGMRRLSHGAALILMVTSILAALGLFIADPLPLFVLMPFLSFSFFLLGLMLPNFNALAMEKVGAIAGTGSSFVGFMTTGIGVLLGGFVGHFYHQSVGPLLVGFACYTTIAVLIVLVTEGGRLMEPAPVPTAL